MCSTCVRISASVICVWLPATLIVWSCRDVTIQWIENRVKIPIFRWTENRWFFFASESIHPLVASKWFPIVGWWAGYQKNVFFRWSWVFVYEMAVIMNRFTKSRFNSEIVEWTLNRRFAVFGESRRPYGYAILRCQGSESHNLKFNAWSMYSAPTLYWHPLRKIIS